MATAINYVTTDAQMTDLFRALTQADETAAVSKGTYFRSLLALAQLKLGISTPRTTTLKELSLLPDHERSVELLALKAVHDHCYELLTEVLDDDPDRNRKSNFARTAVSGLRAWIRVGGSLLDLNVKDISKEKLRTMVRERLPKAAPSLVRSVTTLVNQVEALAASDPREAATQMQNAMNRLGTAMLDLGLSKPAKTPQLAMRQHRVANIEGFSFWPIDRQAAITQQ